MGDFSVPHQPDWNSIIEQCKDKVNNNFFKYANSWEDKNLDLDWWEKRLQHEVAEWIMNRLDTEELTDIIVIAAMIKEKLRG